jgi:predicted DNA-binding protein (UPF0251 family)
MQAVITVDQQNQVLRLAGQLRLSRKDLQLKMNITQPTLRKVLDEQAPIIVSGKTYRAINDFLISELSK